jgi:hypothetical protein
VAPVVSKFRRQVMNEEKKLDFNNDKRNICMVIRDTDIL